MSQQIQESIQSLNLLIKDINQNFDVENLKNDLKAYIAALKKDKEQVQKLTVQIENAKQETKDPKRIKELENLNDEANRSLIASKTELEKYKSTLQFLKNINTQDTGMTSM